jgi:hypothetical protein
MVPQPYTRSEISTRRLEQPPRLLFRTPQVRVGPGLGPGDRPGQTPSRRSRGKSAPAARPGLLSSISDRAFSRAGVTRGTPAGLALWIVIPLALTEWQ